MKTVTLTAHFDGEHIRLDEPFPLPPDARLLVTILPDALLETARDEWHTISKAGLARAYSDDEPDYAASLIATDPGSPASRRPAAFQPDFDSPTAASQPEDERWTNKDSSTASS